jgi:2-desacetyl-2-hydroxyethyl bacteriochlorophyllide A dehydrogenase
VRNRLAGICGSDLHLISADGDVRIAPAALPGHAHTYLGHEVVGEVIEIGDDVQRLQVGDRVVLQHGKNCLSAGVEPPCRSCAAGNYGLCERGTLPGPDPIGGGWSEEMLLHEQQLFRVPSDMSDPQAVLLEPTAVAVHTVLRHVPQAGERVLIIGAGTIGLLTLQVVRALSPQSEISVLARYPFQVEKATRLGAAHIIYPQDSYSGVQQATQAKLYKGILGNQMMLGGYDTIYDTIGTQRTVHNSLRWARAKGTVVLIGLSLHMMQLDLSPIWYQEINLIGTMGQGMETWPLGSSEQRSTFAITADLIKQGILKPEQLITHHFALNNYRQALMTAMDKREQRAIKVIFDYSLLPASVVPNVRASARQRKPVTQNIQPSDVMAEEQPLEHVPAMLSTGGATWEKQALPIVPQPRITHDEAELVDAPTLAPRHQALQDLDATQKVRIVEPEQELLEPTETMPVVERPLPTYDIALQETEQHKSLEQEYAIVHALAQEETQNIPAVESEAIQSTPSIYDVATQAVPVIESEEVQTIPSIHDVATQAVPSPREEVGEIVVPVYSESTETTSPPMYSKAPEVVASIYNEATEAVPSIHSEVTEAVPSVSGEDISAPPSIHEQSLYTESEIAEEAPLNDLEWLDIIAAEETQQETAIVAPGQSTDIPSTPVTQEEQETQPTETTPFVAQYGQKSQASPTTPVPVASDEEGTQSDTEQPIPAQEKQELPSTQEHAFYTFVDDTSYEDADASELQDLRYEREPQSEFRTDDFADIHQDMPVEDYGSDDEQTEIVPEKDAATNFSTKALYPAKTSKALKSRAKNRNKGRK